MKSPPPEAYCAKEVFQIQSPIFSVNVSNNISIPQVRVNLMEIGYDATFELSKLLTSGINLSVVPYFQVNMVKFVHITGKCICETPPCYDLIISHPCKALPS